MKSTIIVLLGGTGFVGTHIANRLTRLGYRVRALTRSREHGRTLWMMPSVDLIEADIHDPAVLETQLRGCEAVINLVGILNERGDDGSEFQHVHAELPRKLIEACEKTGSRRLLHMSALNADAQAGASHYLKSKGEAENIIREAGKSGLHFSIFRPSVIFGPEDSFFNRFARLLRLCPYFFPLTCPFARFAPVYVGDVAQAFVTALEIPAAPGATYELCGPRRYLLIDLVQYTAQLIGVRRRIIPLADETSRRLAGWMERIPGKPFSLDNYRSLQVDSVCRGENGLQQLHIEPTSLESVVPRYLGKDGARADYADFRSAARRQ
ncbi:MAG: complex I NDUFA9 subunit family protein [Gammaproteobacteria bacterium]